MMPSVNQGRRLPVAALLVFAAAAAAGLVWWLSRPTDPAAGLPVLTEEAKAYARHLELSDVEMKATDNTLGQTLVEILGRITNAGDRPVRRVLLSCVFYDPYGQVVARELAAIVREKDGALYAGESRPFRLPFDSLPDAWNQTMPQLVIAEIRFGEGE
jgi:hypothetical protein